MNERNGGRNVFSRVSRDRIGLDMADEYVGARRAKEGIRSAVFIRKWNNMIADSVFFLFLCQHLS